MTYKLNKPSALVQSIFVDDEYNISAISKPELEVVNSLYYMITNEIDSDVTDNIVELNTSLTEFRRLTHNKFLEFDTLVKYLDNIMTKVFLINILGKDKSIQRVLHATFISSFIEDKNTKELSIRFDPMLVNILIDKSKLFVPIDFSVTKKLKSKYAITLYEILRDYAGQGGRTIDVEQLLFMMNYGTDINLKEFYKIKGKIINPSINAINKESDIKVTFKELRDSKTGLVSSIQFFIRRKPNNVAVVDENVDGESLGKAKQKIDKMEKSGVDIIDKNALTNKFAKDYQKGKDKEQLEADAIYVLQTFDIIPYKQALLDWFELKDIVEVSLNTSTGRLVGLARGETTSQFLSDSGTHTLDIIKRLGE